MKSNSIWILISGLAVGILIGREWTRASMSSAPAPAVAAPAEGTPTAKAPSAQTDGPIPADWVTEDKLGEKAAFAGLTSAQRYTVLKFLNETPCDCGCPHGSFAACKAEDPNCPRAPKVIQQAIALAKQGKGVDEIAKTTNKPSDDNGGGGPPPSVNQKVEIATWSPIRGPKLAKVTLVLFSDFQCPFCSRVEPTIKEVLEKYPKDVRVVWRNQPLPFHNHAQEAAEAAMAANAQHKFWEMHDLMFAHQDKLERADLDGYAKQIGLDMAKFKKAMDTHQYKDQVEADSKQGTAYGASGTPTSFINGRQLVGAVPFDAFKKVIDEEIKHADELLKQGTSMGNLYQKLLDTLPASPPPSAGGNDNAPPDHVDVQPGDAPVKGPSSAPVTVVIYSDFQCPFCSRVEPTLKQLEEQYKGKLKFAWKNQPLPFHDHAMLDAEAALAANAQGKFWEYHDTLFAHQQAQERADLEKYAQELGLDVAAFKKALDEHTYFEKVKKDADEGTKLGVTGTPTFFINGYRLVGAQPIDAFKKLIDQELAKK